MLFSTTFHYLSTCKKKTYKKTKFGPVVLHEIEFVTSASSQNKYCTGDFKVLFYQGELVCFQPLDMYKAI